MTRICAGTWAMNRLRLWTPRAYTNGCESSRTAADGRGRSGAKPRSGWRWRASVTRRALDRQSGKGGLGVNSE